jgi:rRNA maturation protein Nop10
LGSQFELDGPCRECGEETLVAEDAYASEPELLMCVDCRRQVAGGPAHEPPSDPDDWYEGRYTVDDPCPLCDGELVPKDAAPPLSARAEFGLARKVAQRLRREAGVAGPRCDPGDIARQQGIELEIGPFAHEGQLIGHKRIEIPASDSPAAQRWAIAHELGHAVLRHEVPEQRIEQEANAFASELLVPREELRRLVASGAGFRDMATTFGVSHQALAWALATVELTERVKRR